MALGGRRGQARASCVEPRGPWLDPPPVAAATERTSILVRGLTLILWLSTRGGVSARRAVAAGMRKKSRSEMWLRSPYTLYKRMKKKNRSNSYVANWYV